MRGTTIIILFLLLGAAMPRNASAVVPQADPARELARLHAGVYLAESNQRLDMLLQELRKLRDLQAEFGAVDSALATSLRVVDLSGRSDNRLAMANDWHMLARVSLRAGDHAGAVAAGKRRLLILKTTEELDLAEEATLDLLDLLLLSKRHDEFKHQSEEVLGVFERQKNPAGQARVLYRQGEHLITKGRSADAITLLHSALRKREMLPDAEETARVLFALAEAHAAVGSWGLARKSFDEALELAPGSPMRMPERYGLLARIHEGAGELETALHYLKREALLKDSIAEANVNERAAHMQMLHAFKANEADRAQLKQESEAALAALRAQRAKTRVALLACAGLSVGLLLLVLLRYRQVNRLKRTLLKNTVIAGQARKVEAKGLELERENLHLAQALAQAKAPRQQAPVQEDAGGGDIQLADLLIRTHLRQAEDPALSRNLSGLLARIQTMRLVHANLRAASTHGGLRLKGHFTALADALQSERGTQQLLDVKLDLVEAGKELQDELLPLSLLVAELLQISMDAATVAGAVSSVSIELRRVAHQYELLYTDHAGAVNAQVLGNGSMSAELVQAWAEVMNGTVLLLRSEVTTFQHTFEPSGSVAMRKAS